MTDDYDCYDCIQLPPLTVRVRSEGDSLAFIVTVEGAFARTMNLIQMIDNQTVDLSSYVPVSGARLVTIESNVTGTLSVNSGVTFAAPNMSALSDVPQPVAGKYPLAIALLYASQTALLNSNICPIAHLPPDYFSLDTGFQINAAPTGTPAGPDKFGFWSDADEVLKSVTWDEITAVVGGQYRQFVYNVTGDDVDILTADGDALFTLENLE